ncbi:MAG TPA: dockerin type I domain-containing protein [Pirellulales bacterium]|jgi:hypothetical protein|nr:dockerin type I domain-containing protein [Pirellulales bacterium]
MKSQHLAIALAAFLAVGMAATGHAQTLRIVTYNLDADTGGATGHMGGTDAGPGLIPVLEAIGNEHLSNGNAQPIDVLALEELDVNGSQVPLTETFIVNQLNAFYGAGTYAVADPLVVDPTTGGTGGGPSGLIYNTKTIADLGAQTITTNLGGNGEARAPIRYQLKPIGGAAYTQFYIYVSHAKSGTTASDATRRKVEAQDVRANAATLGTNAHIIYTGDWNINDSTEQTYQTLVASSPSPGQAIDTANPTNDWTDSSSAPQFWPLHSESATSIKFRDDLQLVTNPTITLPGTQLISNTLTPFGNNGSVNYGGNVSSGSNTALSDLPNRTTILGDLTTDTDHLPVMADYTIVPPGDLNRDQQVNAADLPAMLSALVNMPTFEVAKNLTASQLTLIGDVNGDGKFNNADVQALINFLLAGQGTESVVPEPTSILLFALALPALAWLLYRKQFASFHS